MSKRKRDRLDVGRQNDQKKPKPSREETGITTLHKNRERPTGREADLKDVSAAVVDNQGELKSIRGAKKVKRTNVQENSEGQKAGIQTAPSTNDAPQSITQPGNISTSHDNVELKLVKTKTKKKKKKGKKMKTGEPPKNAEAVSDQRKGSQPKKRKRSQNTKSFWEVSDATGGQMLDLDPIFALNEEYILIAYDAAINVYATSTSMLVRRLCVGKSERVTAFALSPSEPNNIFLSTNTGSIEKWNWVEGARLEYWHISTPIYNLATSSFRSGETPNDLVYTIDRDGEGQWLLTVHRLLGGEEASKTDLGTLIKHSTPFTSVKITENGRIIVLTSGSRLIVGSSDKPNLASLKDVVYIWRELNCSEWISTMDVRIRPSEVPSTKANGTALGFDGALDVAVGVLRGQIIIYDDLLNGLIKKESKDKLKKKTGMSSQELHWHRTTVLALKWSKDGNYIISGGSETVLVLWQLETGKKQVLPHLSTSIESIVVSPSGSAYSVRLADNSNMILSTSERKPTFNVSGIQVPAARKNGPSLPFIPTVDMPSRESLPKAKLRCPAVLHPVLTGRLLAAVPSSTVLRLHSGASHAACYLQTFDVASAQQISKQSLTRTKATTLNMGPEANTIEEPNVLYLQLSHDGQWLATIDEWLPPRRDISMMAFDDEKGNEEQSRRRETYLKFWQWNDKIKVWELLSRIDDPHSSPSIIKFDANMVLELGSDPSSVGFTTMGNDATVKFWKPSIRRRYGKEVRHENGRALSNWSCHYTASLSSSPAANSTAQQGAKLAYSRDGSVLAAGYRISSPSVIHLIDSSNGVVQRTLTGLQRGPLLGMGILNRYLIIISHELRVWDMVTEQHTFGFALQPTGLTVPNLAAGTHLAIDPHEETFAVSLPVISNKPRSDKQRSQIIIFNTKSPAPLFSTSLANIATALLPATGRKGYYVLDSAAEIRIITPALYTSSSTTQEAQQTRETRESERPKGLENIYGNGISASSIFKTDVQLQEQGEEDKASNAKSLVKGNTETVALASIPNPEKPDAVVVTQDALSKIFDTGSAFTLPPIRDLYEQVARLCAGIKGV